MSFLCRSPVRQIQWWKVQSYWLEHVPGGFGLVPMLSRLRTNPSSYVPFWAWPQSGAATSGFCLPSMLSSFAEHSLTLRRSIVLLRHPDATWADSPQMRYVFSPFFVSTYLCFPCHQWKYSHLPQLIYISIYLPFPAQKAQSNNQANMQIEIKE